MAKLRLGGMALSNGVLVHGPTAWACAIRLPDGRIKVASAPKRMLAGHVRQPLLRGPARLAGASARPRPPAPPRLAPRGGELPAYHGAEHISIGSYESDALAGKEHARCGTHL